MDTFENKRYTDKQMEDLAKYRQELVDKFPTRQQRRAEERRRQKEASKKQIKPNRKGGRWS